MYLIHFNSKDKFDILLLRECILHCNTAYKGIVLQVSFWYSKFTFLLNCVAVKFKQRNFYNVL